MSRAGDMSDTIKELRDAADGITAAANWLAETFAPPAEPPLEKETVRAILAEKSRAGHTDEIHALLKKYGADKLSGIDPRNYSALLADVEALKDAT
jgi:hypothetical protein